MTVPTQCIHVGYWHQADVTWARRRFRFQEEGGHAADWLSLPSLTPSRHDGPRLVDHFVGASED
jgi:hypothetical protein